MRQLECSINDMREKKAIDESGLITEYLEAPKDGSREELCMVIVSDRINKWIEGNGMLGEVQGGFRKRITLLLWNV